MTIKRRLRPELVEETLDVAFVIVKDRLKKCRPVYRNYWEDQHLLLQLHQVGLKNIEIVINIKT